MKCDFQCFEVSNRELIAGCAAYLLQSRAPLLHGNEAMNGSMSTGRGNRRAMQLWTPTHETCAFLPIPQAPTWGPGPQMAEGWRRWWWRTWYPVAVQERRGKEEEEEVCDLGAGEIMWCVVLHSFVSVIEQCIPSVLLSVCPNCMNVVTVQWKAQTSTFGHFL